LGLLWMALGIGVFVLYRRIKHLPLTHVPEHLADAEMKTETRRL
jgi:hypothetical protein